MSIDSIFLGEVMEWVLDLFGFFNEVARSEWLSLAAFLLSVYSAIGLSRARGRVKKLELYNSRKNILHMAKQSEIEWQGAVNEMRAFLIDVRVDADLDFEVQKQFIEWGESIIEFLEQSLLDAKGVSKYIFDNFSCLTVSKIEEYEVAFISTFEQLASNRAAMERKNKDLIRLAKSGKRS
ncbi:hypothetical protein WCE02_20225 [Pseudomonas juntendi]|uniref:hypothetical protein n=1 Tax=Pseudomonas juntendi TaxID=2666183 RepID=UPI0034D542DA